MFHFHFESTSLVRRSCIGVVRKVEVNICAQSGRVEMEGTNSFLRLFVVSLISDFFVVLLLLYAVVVSKCFYSEEPGFSAKGGVLQILLI